MDTPVAQGSALDVTSTRAATPLWWCWAWNQALARVGNALSPEFRPGLKFVLSSSETKAGLSHSQHCTGHGQHLMMVVSPSSSRLCNPFNLTSKGPQWNLCSTIEFSSRKLFLPMVVET